MATIKLDNTKNANRLISYCEKKSEISQGINCDINYAKSQFKTTRELWGKNDKVQSHHAIQSFKPNEVTPELANKIGQELVKKIAPNHEACVYTHTDKKHIHNHIVINSVNPETGKKYQSDRKQLYNIREKSNELCKEHGLSVIKDKSAELRYTMAERGMMERGQIPWKEQIRQSISEQKENCKSMKEFQENMKKEYDINVKLRGKNISFKHPEKKVFVRGSKLGIAYEKQTLEKDFSRNGQQQENSIDNLIKNSKTIIKENENELLKIHNKPRKEKERKAELEKIEKKIKEQERIQKEQAKLKSKTQIPERGLERERERDR